MLYENSSLIMSVCINVKIKKEFSSYDLKNSESFRSCVVETVIDSAARATAAYNKKGELVFLKTLDEVAQFVKIPANVISKAMPQNIEKYHK